MARDKFVDCWWKTTFVYSFLFLLRKIKPNFNFWWKVLHFWTPRKTCQILFRSPFSEKWIFSTISGVINALRQIAGIFLTLATYKLETLHYYVNVLRFVGGKTSRNMLHSEESEFTENNSYLWRSGAFVNDNCLVLAKLQLIKRFLRALLGESSRAFRRK